jgi:hypothetical protein
MPFLLFQPLNLHISLLLENSSNFLNSRLLIALKVMAAMDAMVDGNHMCMTTSNLMQL